MYDTYTPNQAFFMWKGSPTSSTNIVFRMGHYSQSHITHIRKYFLYEFILCIILEKNKGDENA